jgi:hypothetical protein
MSTVRVLTLRWAERWSSLVGRAENQRSINRPSPPGSSMCVWVGVSGEPIEVALDAGDDAGVSGDFGVPAALGGVVMQFGDVGNLGLQCGDELGGGDEVVAMFADVGVGAGLGGELP